MVVLLGKGGRKTVRILKTTAVAHFGQLLIGSFYTGSLRICVTNLSCVNLVLWFSGFLPCREGLPKLSANYPSRNYPLKVARVVINSEDEDPPQRRKIHPKKSTRNKKVHLNKFFWTISVGFLTRVTGSLGRQKFARTFRKSSRERGVFFGYFAWTRCFFGISGFGVGFGLSVLKRCVPKTPAFAFGLRLCSKTRCFKTRVLGRRLPNWKPQLERGCDLGPCVLKR